jgi:hypothetical protein
VIKKDVVFCYESFIKDFSSYDFNFLPIPVSLVKNFFIGEGKLFTNNHVKLKSSDFFSNSNIEDFFISGKSVSKFDFIDCFGIVFKVDYSFISCEVMESHIPWFMA